MATQIADLDTRNILSIWKTLAGAHHPDALWGIILFFHVHLDSEMVLSAHNEIKKGAVWMGNLRPPISVRDTFDMADMDTNNGRTTNRLQTQAS